MNPDEILAMMDNLKLFAEAMGGLRKQLIDAGFSEDAAEALVITAAENGTSR